MGGLAGAMNEVDNMGGTVQLTLVTSSLIICVLISLENKFKKGPFLGAFFFTQSMKFLQNLKYLSI